MTTKNRNLKQRLLASSRCVVVALALLAALALDPRGGGSGEGHLPCARAAGTLCTTGIVVDAAAKELKAAGHTPGEIASALWGIADMFKIIGYNRKDVLGRAVFKNATAITKKVPLPLHPKLNTAIKDKIVKQGWDNVKLMSNGYAPIGPDGLQINLHHLIGKEPGPLIELVATTHQQHSKILHDHIEDSFRNYPALETAYNNYRKSYWKLRANDPLP